MIDVTGLAGMVFSGLSALVIEDAEDAGEVIRVRARTREDARGCRCVPGLREGKRSVPASALSVECL